MRQILIAIGFVFLIGLHFAVQPSVTIAKNIDLEETANEYKARCITKTGKDYKYYNCQDLKNYLTKRGYNE